MLLICGTAFSGPFAGVSYSMISTEDVVVPYCPQNAARLLTH